MNNIESVDSALENYITAILSTEEYRTYVKERDKIKQHPQLKAQVDDYRKRNYELQARKDNDFEKLDRFEREFETFRENPLVADFLAAELDFCRLMQRLNMLITAQLDFE